MLHELYSVQGDSEQVGVRWRENSSAHGIPELWAAQGQSLMGAAAVTVAGLTLPTRPTLTVPGDAGQEREALKSCPQNKEVGPETDDC